MANVLVYIVRKWAPLLLGRYAGLMRTLNIRTKKSVRDVKSASEENAPVRLSLLGNEQLSSYLVSRSVV